MRRHILTNQMGERFNNATCNGPAEAVQEARKRLIEDPDVGPITIWVEVGTVTYRPADIELQLVKEEV